VVKYDAISSNFDPIFDHPVMLYTPVFECGSRGYIFSAIEHMAPRNATTRALALSLGARHTDL